MKRITSIFFASLFILTGTRAAVVDTVAIFSNSMHHTIKTVVIRPAAYATDRDKRFPVVYLLHGAGGSYSNWIKYVPHIQKLADDFQIMLVCPDGASTSWYFDSPIDSTFRYETFVGTE